MNAVITGASRGIGKAVAEIFATHGYDLYLCSRNEINLLSAIDDLKQKFPNINVDGKALDLGKKEKAIIFGEWINSSIDTVDILVNNAGTFIPGNISDEPDGALENMLEVNLHSAYHVTRSLLPKMIDSRTGHIFTICSIASLAAYPNGGAYSISKFALLGFTKNLRKELQPHNIKVTAIIPGAVYTDSWKESDVKKERIMKAEDVAKVIYSSSQLSAQAVVEEIVMRPQLGDL
ncbi:MAG: SDR family NAD(P)-dependent oxidoreductase [Flavisolibacter sp.]